VEEYEFEVRGGMTTIDGKSHWPDSLTLFMDRIDAYDIAIRILNQLQHEKLEVIIIQSVGLYRECEGDGDE